MTNRLLLLLYPILLFGCSRKLVLDRSQFLRLGDPAPSINLSHYRSVQDRPNQDPSMALAISISGGGSRSANFAIGIMLGLEELATREGYNALSEVDYLSTVSGGGFAGGAYISALYDHYTQDSARAFSFRYYVNEFIQKDLKRSYLAPIIAADFNPRLLFTPIDDGDALEKAIDDHVLGYRRRKDAGRGHSIRLGELFIPADSTDQPVLFPMQIANSSVINTMAIFPFAPDVIKAYQIDGYSHRMHLIYPKKSIDPFLVPLSVGLKASGSFPVLLSNTTMRSRYNKNRPYLHLIDGAMTDNLGVYTAYEILLQEDPTRRRALIIIDAESDLIPNTFSQKEQAVSPLSVLGGLTTSGLYARKNNLIKELSVLESTKGIKSVILSFKSLIENNQATVPESINPNREANRLIKKMRANLASLDGRDLQILYELTTNIGTKYTIKEEEQELLILTGRLLVKLLAQDILDIMQ